MSRSDFWSRRKAAVEAEQQQDLQALDIAEAEARDAEAAEKSDAEILDELGLPDPDTLSEGDDFRVFLTETVPARIRTRALRRLWTTNPILANVDGLVDYGEDFTDAACVVENLQTAYQVGKGMTAHVEELARQAEEALNPTEVEDTSQEDAVIASEADAEDPAAEDDAAPGETAAEAAETAFANDTHDAAEAQDTPMPRRMRFAFDTADTSL